MNKKNKTISNLEKASRARKEKKYLFLKQALGMGEIAEVHFKRLAYKTDKKIFDRHARRIEANTNKLLIPKIDTA
jgi:hypothetical protein